MGCEVHIIYDRSLNPSVSSLIIKDEVFLHGVGGSMSIRPLNILSFANESFEMLKKIEEKIKPQIYVFHGNYSLLPIPRFRKLTETPLVYHTYTALPEEAKRYLFTTFNWSLPYFIKKGSNYLFYTIIEYMSLRYVDCVIVSSPNAVNEFVKVYKYPASKIYTWPMGGDQYLHYVKDLSIDRIKEKISLPRGRYLLFVGTDWHRKGMKYLLQALPHVLQVVSDVYLIIVGPPQEPFISMAKSLGIMDHLKITGRFVSEKQLAFYYAISDVFILPAAHEGWSETVTEATCFGKPVVATPIAAFPVVEDQVNGLIVPPSNSKALAKALIKILTDDELYMKLSNGAIRKSKLYSWKHVAEETLKIYKEIIKRYEKKSTSKII